MSIYVEEAVRAIEKLEHFCRNLVHKFDAKAPSTDLLAETGELAARIQELITYLPDEISMGDWERMIRFMGIYLRRDEPGKCQSDLEWFVNRTLPDAIKQVRSWASNLGNFDDELRKAVAHLIRIRDFSSAIRAAFVVLTERLRNHFALPSNLDGPALVNEIFGSKSTLTPQLDDKERQAIRDYLAGAYGVLRNKYAHNNPPLDLTELEAALATINLGLKLIS